MTNTKFRASERGYSPEKILNMDVGISATDAGNTFVLKMRFGMMFK